MQKTDKKPRFFSALNKLDSPFNLDGNDTQTTNRQAATIYFLMRGGIEEVKSLSKCSGVEISVICKLDLQRLFLHFDNILSECEISSVDLPPRSAGSKVFCNNCQSLLKAVPCGCKMPDHLSLDRPEQNIFQRRVQMFNMSDRGWRNCNRIVESERVYHGN